MRIHWFQQLRKLAVPMSLAHGPLSVGEGPLQSQQFLLKTQRQKALRVDQRLLPCSSAKRWSPKFQTKFKVLTLGLILPAAVKAASG